MPLPAGTGLSRRSFLSRTQRARAGRVRRRRAGPARSKPGSRPRRPPASRVLVSIFCSGGLDSLSLLAPVGDARYATLRGALALSSSGPRYAFGEDSRLRWHPAAAPLRDLHAAGKLSVIPAIGYDDPNQSHFTSRHYWEVGAIDPGGRVGWLGRYLDRHGAADNPLQGLSLDYTLAPSLATAAVPVAAVSPRRPTTCGRATSGTPAVRRRVSRWGAQGAIATADPELATARRAAGLSTALRTQLAGLQDTRVRGRARSPTRRERFPRRLASLAEMLGRGCRCASSRSTPTAAMTRTRTRPPRCTNLGLSASLAAFQADLEARGIADRVLVHVWSEFGRRPRVKRLGHRPRRRAARARDGHAGQGHDGRRVPRPGDARRGRNLRHTVDFRAVYKGLTEQWLGVAADGIVPGAGAFTAPRWCDEGGSAPRRARDRLRLDARGGGDEARRHPARGAEGPVRKKAARRSAWPRAALRRCPSGRQLVGESRTSLPAAHAAPAAFAVAPGRRPHAAPPPAPPPSRRPAGAPRATPTRSPCRCGPPSSPSSCPRPRCPRATSASSSTSPAPRIRTTGSSARTARHTLQLRRGALGRVWRRRSR